MILLAIPCLLVLVFGVVAFFESFDNEEAIAKGYERENEADFQQGFDR